MDISGKIKVWANDYEGQYGTYRRYSTKISKKNEDGTYTNKYMPIRFMKGIELENGIVIKVNKGFLTTSTYTSKDGNPITQIVAMITDFEQDGEKEVPVEVKKEKPKQNPWETYHEKAAQQTDEEYDELPF